MGAPCPERGDAHCDVCDVPIIEHLTANQPTVALFCAILIAFCDTLRRRSRLPTRMIIRYTPSLPRAIVYFTTFPLQPFDATVQTRRHALLLPAPTAFSPFHCSPFCRPALALHRADHAHTRPRPPPANTTPDARSLARTHARRPLLTSRESLQYAPPSGRRHNPLGSSSAGIMSIYRAIAHAPGNTSAVN